MRLTQWIILLGALLLLQYALWFEPGGVIAAWHVHQQKAHAQVRNAKLIARNAALHAEVDDLKRAHHAVEERARTDLGMIKPDEQYYQVIKDPKARHG